MSGIMAIKKFFGSVTMEELKALDKEERRELGIMSCMALGEEYDEPGGVKKPVE